MPARRSTSRSSTRVSWRPPRKALVIARLLLLVVAWSRPELAVAICRKGFDAWRRQHQHPADVGGRHQVPGGPEHVGPQDRTIRKRVIDGGAGESLRALRHRPPRAAVVLRLDGAEPVNHLGWGPGSGRDEVLVAQPLAKDVQVRQRSVLPLRSDPAPRPPRSALPRGAGRRRPRRWPAHPRPSAGLRKRRGEAHASVQPAARSPRRPLRRLQPARRGTTSVRRTAPRTGPAPAVREQQPVARAGPNRRRRWSPPPRSRGAPAPGSPCGFSPAHHARRVGDAEENQLASGQR